MAPCLLLIPSWGRFCELLAIGVFKYAKPEGKGKVWHETTRMPIDLFKGLAPPLLVTIAFGLAGYTAVWYVMSFSLLGGILFAIYMNNKLGGQTGDTYGATVELAELSALLGLAIFT